MTGVSAISPSAEQKLAMAKNLLAQKTEMIRRLEAEIGELRRQLAHRQEETPR
jgi:hypothetical protein